MQTIDTPDVSTRQKSAGLPAGQAKPLAKASAGLFIVIYGSRATKADHVRIATTHAIEHNIDARFATFQTRLLIAVLGVPRALVTVLASVHVPVRWQSHTPVHPSARHACASAVSLTTINPSAPAFPSTTTLH